MTMTRKISSVFALLCLTTSVAHAGLAVNVLGGLNFDANSQSGSVYAYSPKPALTLGATVEFGGPFISFETGLFSIGKKEEQKNGTIVATWSYRGWLIPALVRFTALPILSFGVGPYYAKFSDKVTISDSTSALTPNGEHTFASQGQSTSDYGLRADARAALTIAPLTNFLIDVYYDWGLKDLDTSSVSKKTRNYGVLAGVSFGF
jgi:hypothetical protein